MNWKLIFSLAAFAVIMGTASVFGLTHGIEPLLWVGIAIVCAYVLVTNVARRLFLHGLFVGIAQGVVNGIVQSTFFSTYLQNNPEVAAQLNQNPFPLSSSVFVLLASPFIGAAYGVFIGLVTLLIAKVMKKS